MKWWHNIYRRGDGSVHVGVAWDTRGATVHQAFNVMRDNPTWKLIGRVSVRWKPHKQPVERAYADTFPIIHR